MKTETLFGASRDEVLEQMREVVRNTLEEKYEKYEEKEKKKKYKESEEDENEETSEEDEDEENEENEELAESFNQAFEGFDIALYEAYSNKEFKRKTRGQYLMLERGDESYIVAKIGNEIEGIRTKGKTSERVKFRSDAELKTFVGEKATEGFTVIKDSRGAKGLLRRSARAIVSFIRRHGLKLTIVGGLVALTIAFVGPTMVPMVAMMAAKMNLGGAELMTPNAGADGMFGVEIEPQADEVADADGIETALQGDSEAPVTRPEFDTDASVDNLRDQAGDVGNANAAAEAARQQAEAAEQTRVQELIQARQQLFNVQQANPALANDPALTQQIDNLNSEIAASPDRIEAAAAQTREASQTMQADAAAAQAQEAQTQATIQTLIDARSSLFDLQAQGQDVSTQLATLNAQIAAMAR